MKLVSPQQLKIEIGSGASVSALLLVPTDVTACFVFAHGAGAGMTHSFMETVADGLYARGVATLRYQFPYMENRSKRPDVPAVAHAAVRAAVTEAARACPELPLIAGGKSFGGRMTSQAQASRPLPNVRGLVFLGFPLHPVGKPSSERAKHLSDIAIPMLFVQGSRDKLAELALLEPVVQGLVVQDLVVKDLGPRATLQIVEHADHSFHVPARSGRNDGEVLGGILNGMVAWIGAAVK